MNKTPHTIYRVTSLTNFHAIAIDPINGKQFSRRAIDIIACIISGRTSKKIASLLAIEPRTVENHIYNIMAKINCNTRGQIIDFIEKSGKYAIFKEHYAHLLMRQSFDIFLKKISGILKSKSSVISIICDKKQKNLYSLIHQLEEDFNTIGIKILLEKNKKLNNVSIEIVDLSSEKNYYFLFLELLKIQNGSLPLLDKIILDFKNEYNTSLSHTSFDEGNKDISENPVLHQSLLEPVALKSDKKFLPKNIAELNWLKINSNFRGRKLVLFAIFGCCFIFCSIWSFNNFNQITFNTSFQGINSTIRWNLPRQDHLFVGRTEALKELQRQLELQAGADKNHQNKMKNTLAISACSGLGGIGKTQLALQYAYHSKYPYSLIAWFPAESYDELKQTMLEFARVLGFLGEEKCALSFVKQYLSEHPGWLLIYDNVPSYAEIESFLPESGGNVILTSRQRLWPSKFNVLDLDVMNEAEAISLLKSQIKSFSFEEEEEQAALKEIVKSLGYLPLAIAQAGAYMQQTKSSAADYLKIYKLSALDCLSYHQLPEGNQHLPVAKTWNISLGRIAEEARDQNETSYSLDLLMVCSYLAPDKIPRDLLLTWMKEAYPKIHNHEYVFAKAIGQLWNYSMIKIDHQNNISIHRLVQSIVQHQHRLGDVNISNKLFNSGWFKLIFNAMHQEFHRQSNEGEVITRQQKLFPHLLTFVNHYDTHWSKSKELELLASELFFDLGIVYDRLGLGKSAIAYLERSLRIKEQLYGVNHINTIPALLRSGMAYKTLGDNNRAKIFLEKVLKVQYQYEGNHYSDLTCLALSSLGIVYRNLGDFQEAKNLQTLALKIQEERYGKNNPKIAKTLLCLCETLGYVGEPIEQKRTAERVLKLFEDSNENHYHIGTAFFCLGYAYKILGDQQQAKIYFEKSLEVQEKCLGKTHPSVANVRHNLENVYKE